MRAILLALTISALSPAATPAPSGDLLLGSWLYDGFFYDGHRYPNPNPDLILRFTFRENGAAHLIWSRSGDPGFCERTSDYRTHDENWLYQKVTWVNPANAPDCAKDPDMQPGKETDNPFSFEDNELRFHFELNGKPFLYILRRCDPNLTGCPSSAD